MIVDLNEYPLLPVFLISTLAILAFGELGLWLGARAGVRGTESVSTLESAILGLLALMIGFTFAMSLSRFEARRDGVLVEANAIGTTALRARLLPAPYNEQSLNLLRDYVQLRLDLARHPANRQDLDAMISRSNAIQEALWQQVRAVAARDNGMVPTGVFIQSLNEMIDNQAKRLAALRNRLPPIILNALYAVAAIAVGFAGYANGLEANRRRLPIHLTGVLVAAMILLIQDLDRPGAGFIKVSQQPMIDTAASLTGFAE